MTARCVLVTGGAGFIGFNFVRDLLAAEPETSVIVLDKLTYAGNPRSLAELAELAGEPRLRCVRGDIGERAVVRELLADARPDAIVHFAAETHVDRSIEGPAAFVQTNVVGTFALLDELRAHLARHPDRRAQVRFLHVSTDEVFGTLGATGAFREDSAYAPRSPYAASKAAADHLGSAYFHTYGVPVVTTNGSNTYGPYQFPEKLIPLVIGNALAGAPLPVYGAGQHVRDWIHVSDHCAALRAVLARGRLGETYLVGARSERTNLEVVHAICATLDELAPRADGASHRQGIAFVADRPGHDVRYAIDPSRLETELGWAPQTRFADGLRSTIAWYLANRAWTDAIRSGAYRAGLS